MASSNDEMSSMENSEYISKFYKCLDLDEKHYLLEQKLNQLRNCLQAINLKLVDLREEFCYYVASKQSLTREERRQISWLIEPNTQDHYVSVSENESYLRGKDNENYSESVVFIEIGPRLNFCSPFSTNAVSILRSSCKQTTVYRLERSTIYELKFACQINREIDEMRIKSLIAGILYDEMVETIYERPVESFDPSAARAKIALGEDWLQPSAEVDILKRGEVALREVSLKLGLFFDDWDINYYVTLFRDTIKRNPTIVECFDLAQSNSEHSRHWFFKGILDVEGRKASSKSLIDMVASTQKSSNQNNIIKFEDNSSAIIGFNQLTLLRPRHVGCCTPIDVVTGSSKSNDLNTTPTPTPRSIVGSSGFQAAEMFKYLSPSLLKSAHHPKSTKLGSSNSNTNTSTTRHIIFTAETHNFPTGVAPFPGAATGTGGRIRDVQATGRGAHVIAGTAGYSFGNLLLDDYELDWENPHELYSTNLAQPWRIAIEASNGASDYGNKFGEPIICGFARSFGQRLVESSKISSNEVSEMYYDNDLKQEQQQQASERWEYLKPIMFTGGIGSIDDEYTSKLKPEPGMFVAKIGGPVYRIGIGGGAASSASGVDNQVDDQESENDAKKGANNNQLLNFNAVQRGDPEMEQKLNRIIRACIENRSQTIDDFDCQYNPIFSIHDQGAGGNGNVLKEIVDPLGATINANNFTLGDHTVNVLELWAAEYQESDAILACPSKKSLDFLNRVSRREKCKIDFVGQVENSGLIRLKNFINEKKNGEKEYPIDLKLDYVIGSMPRKVFNLLDYNREQYLSPAKLIEFDIMPPPKSSLQSCSKFKMMMLRQAEAKQGNYLAATATASAAHSAHHHHHHGHNQQQSQMMNNFEHLLMKVLKLPSVGSKRYLTTKVDRCVTGLIAGQQCLGPLHTPISDYALIALSHFNTCGAVTSIGEQPIKGLVSPISNATMSVAEALTNMMFCVITSLRDIKCSANWMWAAKLPGEGAKLLDACDAMCKLMSQLGIAVDGGKDSLSMSAIVDPKNARKLIDSKQQQQLAPLIDDDGNHIYSNNLMNNEYNIGSGGGGTESHSIEQQQQEDLNDLEVVKSPGTLVISAYAPVPDINMKVTPILRCKPKLSHLIYVNLAHPAREQLSSSSPTSCLVDSTKDNESNVAAAAQISSKKVSTTITIDSTSSLSGSASATTCNDDDDDDQQSESTKTKLSKNKFRLGGSAILQTLGQIGDEAPNIDHPELLRDGFELIQELIKEGICTAGHDVSDGGLIVCALEMALASNCGLNLNIQAERAFRSIGCANNDERILAALFAEECSVVIEVEAENETQLNDVLAKFEKKNIQAQRIGFGSYENQRIVVKFEQQLLLEHENNSKLRNCWEATSRQFDLRQANRKCVLEEYENINSRPNKPDWKLTFNPNETKIITNFDQHYLTEQPKVAVLREEGINGDREMIASLALAGFQVFDVTVSDLMNDESGGGGVGVGNSIDLNVFNGIVFPGGFSYADVFGSGRGWAAALIFNQKIRQQLLNFRRRSNTFSLGVCNGCQLMSLLGFLDDLPDERSNKLIEFPQTSVRLEHNSSGRFECRFVNVRIETTTNSIMLRDMEESVFGVWVAHGEGKFKIEQSVEVDSETRIALRYVDDRGEPTMEYPLNPNGSDQAVAGLCSRDGRHLAMMPHPERCTQMWQWPYVPHEWNEADKQVQISPWMQMFVNAYDFCRSTAAAATTTTTTTK